MDWRVAHVCTDGGGAETRTRPRNELSRMGSCVKGTPGKSYTMHPLYELMNPCSCAVGVAGRSLLLVTVHSSYRFDDIVSQVPKWSHKVSGSVLSSLPRASVGIDRWEDRDPVLSVAPPIDTTVSRHLEDNVKPLTGCADATHEFIRQTSSRPIELSG